MMSEEMVCRKRRLSSFQIIILGFAGVILLGAVLLMLPLSTTAGCVTPFHEALFTATSAVCVTALCGAGSRQRSGGHAMFARQRCTHWPYTVPAAEA